MAESVLRSTRAPDIEVAPLEDGAILFDAASSKFFMLNRSATALWNELESPRSDDELATELCAQFPDLVVDEARRDVQAALDLLGEAGLITRE
jgi:PqqD family protein of HPr-rel-A system